MLKVTVLDDANSKQYAELISGISVFLCIALVDLDSKEMYYMSVLLLGTVQHSFSCCLITVQSWQKRY